MKQSFIHLPTIAMCTRTTFKEQECGLQQRAHPKYSSSCSLLFDQGLVLTVQSWGALCASVPVVLCALCPLSVHFSTQQDCSLDFRGSQNSLMCKRAVARSQYCVHTLLTCQVFWLRIAEVLFHGLRLVCSCMFSSYLDDGMLAFAATIITLWLSGGVRRP